MILYKYYISFTFNSSSLIKDFFYTLNNKNLFSRLYHKTKSLAPMYENWCFDATKGTPPDFVLKTNRNCCVYALNFELPIDTNDAEDTAANLINRYAHRISSIKVKRLPKLMNSMKCMKPTEYPHLTSLDLKQVEFDNDSLLLLAPQLEHLSLVYMDNEFDISTVDEQSKCFTKLKTLKIVDTMIDGAKVLSKCSNKLEYLELDSLSGLELTELEFSHLEHLSILFCIEYDGESLKNLLSKCCSSLKTLMLSFMEIEEIGLHTLLEQTMNITTLELEFESGLEDGIDIFLNKCPLLQTLTISGYCMDINGLILKDLTTLKLDWCESKCITSILNQSSKYFLKTVDLNLSLKVIMECQFPVISTLDKILVKDSAQGRGIRKKPVLKKIMKLFPSDLEVRLIV